LKVVITGDITGTDIAGDRDFESGSVPGLRRAEFVGPLF